MFNVIRSSEKAASQPATVSGIEDLFVQNLSIDKQLGIEGPLLNDKLTPGPPCRPGYGTQNSRTTSIALVTNNFHLDYLSSDDTVTFHIYSINVRPETGKVPPRGSRLIQLVRLLFAHDAFATHQNHCVIDFFSKLITHEPLPLELLQSGITLQYRDEREEKPSEHAQTYTFSFTKLPDETWSANDSQDYACSHIAGKTIKGKDSHIQAMNIFLSHYRKASPDLAMVNRRIGYPMYPSGHEKYDLGDGIVALRGFCSSFRIATGRLLVNVNLSHGAFHQPESLVALIKRYKKEPDYNLRKLQAFLKGFRVELIHLINSKGESTRRMVVFGLADIGDGDLSDSAPEVSGFGAGPKNVQFLLKDTRQASQSVTAQVTSSGIQSGSKGKGKPQDHFVSVFDYYKEGRHC